MVWRQGSLHKTSLKKAKQSISRDHCIEFDANDFLKSISKITGSGEKKKPSKQDRTADSSIFLGRPKRSKTVSSAVPKILENVIEHREVETRNETRHESRHVEKQKLIQYNSVPIKSGGFSNKSKNIDSQMQPKIPERKPVVVKPVKSLLNSSRMIFFENLGTTKPQEPDSFLKTKVYVSKSLNPSVNSPRVVPEFLGNYKVQKSVADNEEVTLKNVWKKYGRSME